MRRETIGLSAWLQSNRERTQIEPIESEAPSYDVVDWAETAMECIVLEGNAADIRFTFD